MKKHTKLIFGLILILWGMSLLAHNYGIYYISFGNLVPYFFIAVGVWLIIRRRKIETLEKIDREAIRTKPPMPSQSINEENVSVNIYAQHQAEQKFENMRTYVPKKQFKDKSNKISYNKFIGDIFVNLNNLNLDYVEISTFIGDIEVNLTGGIIKEGLNRIIISSFIGNIRIISTHNTPIFINSSNFIGDINCLGRQSSGLGNNISAQTQIYEASIKKLYIAANSFIGDIKITEI